MLKDDPNIRLNARAYKMSKSRGNVINPDDVVSEYGADSLRLYEMFMGPLRYIFFHLTFCTDEIKTFFRKLRENLIHTEIQKHGTPVELKACIGF